jgi:hypothetical protein
MKCPACWAEKAYHRRVKGWKGVLLKCLSLVPMQCHHCFHKFTVPWLMTIGKPVTPPKLIPMSPEHLARPSYAAQCCHAARHGKAGSEVGVSCSGENRVRVS